MFSDFAVSNAEEVIETGVKTGFVPFAHAQHEVTFCKHAMDPCILDVWVVTDLGFQCRPKCGHSVSDLWIVLDQLVVEVSRRVPQSVGQLRFGGEAGRICGCLLSPKSFS